MSTGKRRAWGYARVSSDEQGRTGTSLDGQETEIRRYANCGDRGRPQAGEEGGGRMSNDNDTMGDRMKGYERAARTDLPRRLPVIIRVDGKAFHTYTRVCERPFDARLASVMQSVAMRLCDEIQGAQLAYLQSDEISILVHGYKRHASHPWFQNAVQKMVSVAAGIASATFTALSGSIFADGTIRPAVFDARAFAVPEADVCNAFLWRQQDATRNSIQMLARSLYSHKECHLRNTSELQDMCWAKGHNWNDLETRWKRGTCVVREVTGIGCDGGLRQRWAVDVEPPIFSRDRPYIERLLVTVDESGEVAA
jgi:tRNA(His) guanylyltransferase